MQWYTLLMSYEYDKSHARTPAKTPVFTHGLPGPLDLRLTGESAQRSAGASGYVLQDARGEDATYYVRERAYRGLIRYESPRYSSATDDEADPGTVMVCTRPFDSRTGSDPAFIPLGNFMYGASSNCLEGATPGSVVNSKCVVYSASGRLTANGVSVICEGSETFAVSPNGDIHVGSDKFRVGGADGETVVRGGLSVSDTKFQIAAVSGNVVAAGNLDVAGTSSLAGAAMSGSLSVAGEVRATQFVAVSDASKKSDIQPIEGATALAHIRRLVPCSYNMVGAPATRRAGLLAQDVRDVFPHCVVCDANGVLGVNYIDILAHLISAIQSLSGDGGSTSGDGLTAPAGITTDAPAPACAGCPT